jgi:hypothetical protein
VCQNNSKNITFDSPGIRKEFYLKNQLVSTEKSYLPDKKHKTFALFERAYLKKIPQTMKAFESQIIRQKTKVENSEFKTE